MVTSHYNLAGVIGSPVGHSRSPTIHNYWMELYGLKGCYIPIETSRKDFPQVLQTLPKMGFRGVNITIPHKESVLRQASVITDTAAVIGAANTVIFRKDGTAVADNTDGIGFINNLKDMVPEWQADEGPAMVIGAGGAARAAIHALLLEGVPTVFLTNRTRERAEMLVTDFGNRVKLLDLSSLPGLIPTMMTVVNTTSLGMTGMPSLSFPHNRLNPKAVVYDVVYTPRETDFLVGAYKRGCTVVDGLGMLLHQAALSFYYWFNIKPEINDQILKIATEE